MLEKEGGVIRASARDGRDKRRLAGAEFGCEVGDSARVGVELPPDRRAGFGDFGRHEAHRAAPSVWARALGERVSSATKS